MAIDFAAGTTGAGNTTVARFDGAPSGTGGLPAGDNVSAYRTVIAADAGPTVGAGTQVRFDASQFGGIGAPGDIDVYARPRIGAGTFALVPTTYDAGAGEIEATVDGFSEFVFVSDTNPLPVELATFTATADEQDVVLTWQTLTETNNAGFSVEQQTGAGGAWTEVAFVEGAGTTAEAQTYRHRAPQAGYGQHAFRLRQIDFDGTAALSEAVEVNVGLDGPYAVDAYPNPFRAGTGATVDLAVRAAQDVTVGVYDVLGRRVAVLHDGPVAAGTTERLRLTGQGLASGVYLVRVVGERFQTDAPPHARALTGPAQTGSPGPAPVAMSPTCRHEAAPDAYRRGRLRACAGERGALCPACGGLLLGQPARAPRHRTAIRIRLRHYRRCRRRRERLLSRPRRRRRRARRFHKPVIAKCITSKAGVVRPDYWRQGRLARLPGAAPLASALGPCHLGHLGPLPGRR